MNFLLQAPIVIEVTRQPPVSPQITYTEVILGAVGVAGAIMLVAALIGVLTGGAIIWMKKRGEARGTKESEAVTLNI